MKDIEEASGITIVKRRLLEKDVQKLCVDWARRRGYWVRKFSSMTQISVPDYLFAMYDSRGVKYKFACEFKAPRKTSTKAQIDEQEAMRLAGWFVFECDDVEKFRATVIAYEHECA